MKTDELAKELKKGRIRPAYLLVGDEALLRDDAVAQLKAAVLEPGSADFNLDPRSGGDADSRWLEEAVRALPVMAKHRLVILSEPEGRRAGNAALLDTLAAILPDLARQEETVLVVTAAKVDKRSRWFKAFKEPAAVVECDAPRAGRALVAFIGAEAKRQEIALGAGAAELLAERVGPQLLMLRQEIAKAALLAGPGAKVERSHVEISSNAIAEQSIWDLTDAIGAGHTADALVLLDGLLRSGSNEHAILATLAGHFRKLARLRSGGSVAGPPFVVKKLQAQARRYTRRRLLDCLRAIHDCDLALKGMGALKQEKLVIERLVLGLAS